MKDNLKKKFRDLFTEKHRGKSYFHKDNMETYKRRVTEGFYEAFYSPVYAIDINYFEVLQEIEKQSLIGKDHILFKNYQKIHARSLSDNIVIPYLDIVNSTLTDLILINDPNDCERIAMKHTKKMPNFVPLLYDSLISTTDVKQWKEQRMEFVEAFSPIELNSILSVSH